MENDIHTFTHSSGIRGSNHEHLVVVLLLFSYSHLRTLFIAFRDRERERGSGERETLMQERSIDWLPPLHTFPGDWTCPDQGLYTPGPGIEPTT